VPYAERVDRALKTILGPPGLDRSAAQVARPASPTSSRSRGRRPRRARRGSFKSEGGFARANKIFDGKLAAVLGDLHDALWQ
jgi:hypothetical protein